MNLYVKIGIGYAVFVVLLAALGWASKRRSS